MREPQRRCGVKVLSATDLASFVRLQLCGRYLAFQAGKSGREVQEILDRFQTLVDPAYQEVGLRAEEALLKLLEERGFQPAQGLQDKPTWEEWLEVVKGASPGENLYAREVEIAGRVGAFDLKGRMDIVLLHWPEDPGGGPRVRVLELKASRRNRSHHYVQLALYASLVHGMPPSWKEQRVEVDYLVVRVDPGTLVPEDPLRSPTGEERELLDQALRDVAELLKEGGLVEDILRVPNPFEIPYTLNARCDACGYNTVCLRKAQEGRALELLSLPGDVVRALREAGFSSLQDLAAAGPEDNRWAEALKLMENPVPPIQLAKRAQARLATLEPERSREKKYYPVQALPDAGFGTLPPYEIEGKSLIRIYLVVEKDLVAERLNALVAHVTSGRELLPEEPLSLLKEGRFVVKMREEAWSGDPSRDDAEEGELIRSFFEELVSRLKEEVELWDTFAALGGSTEEKGAPLHFYVWSQADIKNLVEAILRVGPKGGSLLEAFWHLMGCREGLEQLIFSSLSDEVRTRYAVGYTSHSLIAVTSLPWFGKSFPWKDINLKDLFKHWLFDFRHYENGRFMEVRSRNYDTLPPVYWRFFWGKEPSGELSPKVKQVLGEASRHIPAYLRARALALRWLEEHIKPKNKQLQKPLMLPEELPDFRLEARDVLRVARDFLRFEQQVRLSLWLADKTLPPGLRVRNGTSLLLENLQTSSECSEGAEEGDCYVATISSYPPGTSLRDLEAQFTLGPGDFVRVATAENSEKPQNLKDILFSGFTAILKELDWTRGKVKLAPVFSRNRDHYVLQSQQPQEGWTLATMDPSPSDYVGLRVDAVLTSLLNGEKVAKELGRWFDPQHPQIPPVQEDSALIEKAKRVLQALDGVLNESQKEAILEGLRHRVQILQGPPGTGKTQTTAVALLLWAQFLLSPGEVSAVAAATHTAVDTLMKRTKALEGQVKEAFSLVGERWHHIQYRRLGPRPVDHKADLRDEDQAPEEGEEQKGEEQSIQIDFGTTSSLLKLRRELKLLVVDEASMMIFPHFLALASRLSPLEEGRILLTGDHRQLSPVIQHQWEEEDRPGVQRYLPYLSAFEAMLRVREAMPAPEGAIAYSVLDHTHRLPQEVRLLIQPLYRRDGVTLRGREAQGGKFLPANLWKAVWEEGEGVYLFVHGERESRKRNPLEAEVIRRILEAAPGVNAAELAVVTPFRAHRTLLRERLGERVGLVDTVERLQGGERRVIFYSASASDPDAITGLQEFLLDVNRTNVAFSRAKEKLVVVVAETLLHYVPPEQEAYQDAVLWKELRRLCTQLVGEDRVDGHRVQLWVPRRG
ncbi:hypothetical protein CSW23_02820 [Thermus scotoductus]|uniref:Helicase ATP-binding domain-containing protein n=1 Tax=Thermus scotoductus TaxID=37636 RepID=A0A430V5W7_THESC|nr:hypothetical protein CSW31_03205 [Thermus scotoductus]RTI19688.1 hypothetical protein CSW23_02820 [Thermus scotoductus]